MTNKMSLTEAKKVIRKANARLLSEFEKASGRIEVSCLECSHVWSTTVTKLRIRCSELIMFFKRYDYFLEITSRIT